MIVDTIEHNYGTSNIKINIPKGRFLLNVHPVDGSDVGIGSLWVIYHQSNNYTIGPVNNQFRITYTKSQLFKKFILL
jgi:hypothetical protein